MPTRTTSDDRTALRVLVVSEDGGAMSRLLALDHGLDVQTVDGLGQAPRAVCERRPEVVVVALALASTRHPPALRAFRQEFGNIPVLLISAPSSERIVTEFIKAGAGGYLFSAESHYAPTAVRELVRGGAPMSLPVSRIVLGRARRNSQELPAVIPPPSPPPPLPAGDVRLTPRQQQILELLAGGHSYDDIGLALDLSVNTVRSHVKALYERLGASTKVEAVLIGIERHMLRDSGVPREPRPVEPPRDERR
jgi:DNA-binding NarL/FixJ family response regulator